MRARWITLVAASAVLALPAATDLAAQGPPASVRARQQAEQTAREAERERLRIERAAQARQDTRTVSERERERERLRIERERENERERLRSERERVAERERLARRQEIERRARERQRERMRAGNSMNSGPAFCRSGAGHPVHGRDWCRQKGFGIGNDRWDRVGWGDVILRQPRSRNQRLGRSVLADVLGSTVLQRFETHGRRQFGNGIITGDWLTEYDTRVLQLNIGGVPFARLIDVNRDGRAEAVLLRR